MPSSKELVHRLYKARLRGDKAVRSVLDNPAPLFSKRVRKKAPKYIKGVHNGNYFRIKIPRKQVLPDIPKLPHNNPAPKPFQQSSEQILQVAAQRGSEEAFSSKFQRWIKANWATLVLNFGSICGLVGFTRSDILELRSLSTVGSLGSVIYNFAQPRIMWPAVGWSSLFAAVNGVKIGQILMERNADVRMTEEEEEIYTHFFMDHGVTPKQFERMYHKAAIEKLHKGSLLTRKGDVLDRVYLVVDGSTHAFILGRTLTAASTSPETKKDRKEGGDSGAWVGEMAFLDHLYDKDQGKEDPEDQRRRAIYTIYAKEDCIVLSWTHEELEELMASSTDLRAALTRAMTSALVGKVVNLSISRSAKGLPHWSSWLKDWQGSDASTVQVTALQRLPEGELVRRDSNLLEKADDTAALQLST